MIKNKKQWKIKPTFDRWLVIASAILAMIMIAIAVSSLVFLSNNLFKAFVPDAGSGEKLQFNIEGYENVLRAFNRTPSATSTE